jgi:hypothetical protein
MSVKIILEVIVRSPHEGVRGLPGLPNERAVVVGSAKIDVDALHLVAIEDEKLGIAESLAALGDATIGHEGLVAFEENPLQYVPFDPVAVFPAAFEIGRLVDRIVVGTGEAEIVAERVLDELAIVGEIGCEDLADRPLPCLLRPFNAPSSGLLGTIWKYGSASFITRANEGRAFSRSK